MTGSTVNVDRNNAGSSFHFDLNLSPPPDEEEEEEEEQIDDSDQTQHEESQSAVVNASERGERQENDNGRMLEVGPEEGDEITDYSDQTHHQDAHFPVGNAGDGGAIQEDDNERMLEAGPEEQKENEEEEKNKRQRRLAALLEVVRIVSGDDGRSEPMDPAELLLPVDNTSAGTSATTDHDLTRNPQLHLESEEEEKGQKNAAAAAVEEEPVAGEKAPAEGAEVAEAAVVRTKRGRPQVLPNKYRDSFVEPITNLSSRYNRSSSSSSSSKHVPSKRRSTR